MKTENVPNGTSVGYMVTNPQDVGLNESGEFIVDDKGMSELKITPIEDYKSESLETLVFTLVSSTFGGNQYANVKVSVEIVDTSTPPSYELRSSASSVDEGDTVTITLNTTNVNDGTKVAYSLTNHTDLGLEDSTGEFEIINGTATQEFGPVEDYALEGEKEFTLKLVGTTMNPEGDWNGKSISVAINDTSVPTPTPTPTDTPTPIPSYELLSSKTEVDEGEELVITLKTENVPSGAIVNYSVTHPDDVDGLSATGEFVVSESGITELKITPIEDYQTEGPETLTFTLTNSNFGGNQYEDVTVSVKINDTSSFPTYKLEASEN